MANRESGSAFMSTGSLSRGAPGAMVAVVLPPKVTTWSVPGRIEAPSPATAICAPPTWTGVLPYSLLKRMRTLVPPPDRRTIWRTVWSLKVGLPGKRPPAGVGAWGEAAQLRAQVSAEAGVGINATAQAPSAPATSMLFMIVPPRSSAPDHS